MTIAIFIYQHIFCRYLAPGQCVIHDRGSEFCNKLCAALMEQFDVEIRPIHAGHPQSNGQVEKYVGILKEKMKAIMAEVCNQKKKKKNQNKFRSRFEYFFISNFFFFMSSRIAR